MKKRSKKKNPANMRYLAERRWVTNKLKKMERQLKRHPNDEQTRKRFEYLLKH